MKVAIYGRNFDPGFKEYVKRFFEIILENNIEITIYKKFFDFLIKEINLNPSLVSVFSKHHEIKNDVDFIIYDGELKGKPSKLVHLENEEGKIIER